MPTLTQKIKGENNKRIESFGSKQCLLTLYYMRTRDVKFAPPATPGSAESAALLAFFISISDALKSLARLWRAFPVGLVAPVCFGFPRPTDGSG